MWTDPPIRPQWRTPAGEKNQLVQSLTWEIQLKVYLRRGRSTLWVSSSLESWAVVLLTCWSVESLSCLPSRRTCVCFCVCEGSRNVASQMVSLQPLLQTTCWSAALPSLSVSDWTISVNDPDVQTVTGASRLEETTHKLANKVTAKQHSNKIKWVCDVNTFNALFN